MRCGSSLCSFCCFEGRCLDSSQCCEGSPCDSGCCQNDVCLDKMQCLIEKNITYLYYLLSLVFLIFIFAVFKLRRQQKTILKKKKKRKTIKKVLLGEVKSKEEKKEAPVVCEQLDLNLKTEKDEFKLPTEREEFLGSDPNLSHSKEFGFLSNTRKDMKKYVIKDRGSILHVNLHALSQTKKKILNLAGTANRDHKNLGRLKSIHVERPFKEKEELDFSMTHKKYLSLDDWPTNR